MLYVSCLPTSLAQHPLQHVIYAPAKFEVPTPNGLGGDAFTGTLLTDAQRDGRQTDFGTKLIYPFSKEIMVIKMLPKM